MKLELVVSIGFLALGSAWAKEVAPPNIDLSSGKVRPAPSFALFKFDQDLPGTFPVRWTTVSLNTHSSDAWHVQADDLAPSPPNDLIQQASISAVSAQAAPWTAAVVKDVSIADGDVSFKFKIKSKGDTQTIGIVYRYQDPQNFDLVAASAGNNMLTVSRVRKGKWKTQSEGSAIIMADLWHVLRVVYIQDTYRVFLGDEMLLAGSDRKGIASGLVGLATTGDSAALFDDFLINAPAVVVVPPAKS